MNQVKFAGAPFKLGGVMYIVPGLSLRQIRDNRDTINGMVELEKRFNAEGAAAVKELMFDVLDAASKVVTLALQRNYPGITEDRVIDLLDMNNARTLLATVMGQSGFELVTELPSEVAGEQTGEH